MVRNVACGRRVPFLKSLSDALRRCAAARCRFAGTHELSSVTRFRFAFALCRSSATLCRGSAAQSHVSVGLISVSVTLCSHSCNRNSELGQQRRVFALRRQGLGWWKDGLASRRPCLGPRRLRTGLGGDGIGVSQAGLELCRASLGPSRARPCPRRSPLGQACLVWRRMRPGHARKCRPIRPACPALRGTD